MPQRLIAIFTLIALCTAGFWSEANGQMADEGIQYSRFEVVNRSDGRVKIEIFKSTDKSCTNPQRKIIVRKNIRDQMRCVNKSSDKRNRCKIRVTYLGNKKNKVVCKDLSNECHKTAIRMPDQSRIVVDPDASEKSGITCSTTHNVKPDTPLPDLKS